MTGILVFTMRLSGVLLAIALACGCGSPVEVRGVVRDARNGHEIADAIVRGPSGETRSDAQGRFRLEVPSGQGRLLRAAIPSLCPGEARVDAREGAQATIYLFPRLEVEEEHVQVGFDHEIVLEARTRCDPDVEITWRQTSGPSLDEARLRVEERGRKVTLRTHALSDLVTLDPRLSVVPLSRHERGDYRFDVTGAFPGGEVHRAVRVTAASPSTGVFQVPTGAVMYLNGGEGEGHGFRMIEKPEGSNAELVNADTRTPSFVPDRFGTYMFEALPAGRQLLVQAGAYDDVPRDCGRDGCHRPEDEGWAETAHARTFRRGLEGELGPEFDERCWGCHATGVEHGVDTGGLHITAQRVGFHSPDPDAGEWDDAPRQIRRHGSVWCSACHGPGRILPPPFHWEYGAKFQVGVCARCHDVVDDPDANHTSLQVREWQLAPMSRFVDALSERDPALREGCASCHTAQGFIHSIRQAGEWEPERSMAAAIACTTCHDPHDASRPSALRVHDAVPAISGAPAMSLGAGAICASCHRADVAHGGAAGAAPHSPQASVLLGRGVSGARPSANPHALIANTCVACHMAPAVEGDAMRGGAGGHTFSVRDLRQPEGDGPAALSPRACSGCHGATPPRDIGGLVDRDGDGTPGTITEEFLRAFTRAKTAADARIASANVADRCESRHTAASYAENDALLVLTATGGALLGDCDGDGRFAEGERAVTYDALPAAVRTAIHDLATLEKDGSRGIHNPRFTFETLAGVERSLR